jgi:hypothetical protein
MNANPISPKEKKLRNLRNILWIVFSAVAVTILLFSVMTVPVALLLNKTTNILSLFANEAGMVLLSLVTVVFVKIAVMGIICLVIYYIFKYRLEKDDDLFL